MPKILLNTKGINLQGFEPIPAGVYIMRIDTSKAKPQKSRNSDDSYIRLGFQVVSGEYKNRWVWDIFMISGNGVWKLARMLKNLGFDVEDKENFAFDTNDLENLQVKVKVSVKPDQRTNELRNQIEEVMPLDDEAEDGSGINY